MTELFLPLAVYNVVVDRLLGVAGNGNTDQIWDAIGPFLLNRPGLGQRLADLDPCPVTGRMTDNEIKHCLGEHGDIWPISIRPHVMLAYLETSNATR